jgi:hypothetical protein
LPPKKRPRFRGVQDSARHASGNCWFHELSNFCRLCFIAACPVALLE